MKTLFLVGVALTLAYKMLEEHEIIRAFSLVILMCLGIMAIYRFLTPFHR